MENDFMKYVFYSQVGITYLFAAFGGFILKAGYDIIKAKDTLFSRAMIPLFLRREITNESRWKAYLKERRDALDGLEEGIRPMQILEKIRSGEYVDQNDSNETTQSRLETSVKGGEQ